MTIWTPDGEKKIEKEPNKTASVNDELEITGLSAEELANLTPEQQEQAKQMAAQLSAAREQILQTEASDIVANHAMGLYELAAIHLTADKPKLDQAKLAVDALDALVSQLTNRLGEAEKTLNEALHQIKLAYVQQSEGEKEAK